MVDDDLSHYDVLGVEPTADKEQIRSAYQERLDEIRADQAREQAAKKPNESVISASRDREARLRAAWQVLSDPYQRGRYDATVELGNGVAGDGYADDYDGEVVDDVDESELSPRERRARQRAEMLANRPPGMFSPLPSDTPASWPPGATPPPPRARSIALLIDIFVLYIILMAFQFLVTPAVLEEAYPKAYTEFEASTDCLQRLDDEERRDSTNLARIQRIEQSRDCQDVRVAFAENTERPQQRLERNITRVEDRRDALTDKFAGVSYALAGGTILIMLLYLVPSSVVSGRTLGKRMMQVRVIHEDGTRLTFVGALKRYGLPVIAALLISTIGLGPIGFVVVLFVILSWPRNPNLQGMHDRVAKTIVVDG